MDLSSRCDRDLKKLKQNYSKHWVCRNEADALKPHAPTSSVNTTNYPSPKMHHYSDLGARFMSQMSASAATYVK